MESATITAEALGAFEAPARIAYEQQDWAELRAICADVLAIAPNSDQFLLYLARIEIAERNWSKAAALWARVSAARPGWAEPLFQTARAWSRAGERQRANAAVEQFAAANMTDAASLRLLGRVASEAAVGAAALDAYTRLATLDPALALAECEELDRGGEMRAALIGARGLRDAGAPGISDERFEELTAKLVAHAERVEAEGALLDAFSDFLVLGAAVPDHEVAARAIGRTHRQLMGPARQALREDNLDEARNTFSLALTCFPDDQEALQSLGRVLMRQRDYAAAEPIWTRLAGLTPDAIECKVQLARILERTGRLPAAHGAWLEVLASDAEHAEAAASLPNVKRNMLAQLRTSITGERWFNAWEWIQTIRAIDAEAEGLAERTEQVGRSALRVMRAAYKQGGQAEILHLGEITTDLIPHEPEAWLLIGRAAMELRKFDVALPAWHALLALEPDAPANPKLQIARCHDRLGQRAEAREAAEQVLARDPEHAEAAQILARS